tara:strand:+ start:4126 stop:5673 length:1548 start_codon:yes stop_codon:yes gene_type:complete
MSETFPIFGIDLGTTNSAIARVDDRNHIEVLPNQEGDRLTPSAVLFEGESLYVGNVAAEASGHEGGDVVRDVKRFIGDEHWLWEHNDIFYTPSDIHAIILKKLAQDAEQYTSIPVKDAVISVPAYFNDLQRKATLEAASLAGIRVHRLINEPTAAALAYGYDLPDEDGLQLVVDLGGGTFDVTLLQKNGTTLDIIASNGHARLGGKDWDDRLIHYFSVDFVTHYGVDPLDDPIAYQQLQQRTRSTKHALSRRNKSFLSLSHAGFQHQLQIDRETFESLGKPLLDQCKALCDLVLEDANTSWAALQNVFLVGGATRMPSIQAWITNAWGKPGISTVNPDEAVVKGAALEAARIANTQHNPTPHAQAEPSPYRLKGSVQARDITNHTLGIVVLDSLGRSFVDTLLPRHTSLPASTQHVYYTAYDNQVSVTIQLVEGESKLPEECVEIGSCEITGLPPRPAGQRVELHLGYDLNGALSVELYDTGSNTSQRVDLQRGSHRTATETQWMKRQLQSVRVQ